jgi:hypothetical protein
MSGGRKNVMSKKIDHLSELAYIRALPDYIIPQIHRGRLKNRCKKLITLIDKEINKLSPWSDAESKEIGDRIAEFGKRTGWENTEKHIVTLLSFLLAMIEESTYKYNSSIVECLNDIHDYFERDGRVKIICNVAGCIASDKWNSIAGREV